MPPSCLINSFAGRETAHLNFVGESSPNMSYIGSYIYPRRREIQILTLKHTKVPRAKGKALEMIMAAT